MTSPAWRSSWPTFAEAKAAQRKSLAEALAQGFAIRIASLIPDEDANDKITGWTQQVNVYPKAMKKRTTADDL